MKSMHISNINQNIISPTNYFGSYKPEESLFTQLLEKRAREIPDQTFFTFEDQSFSYADFNKTVNGIALRLQGCGVGEGTVFAVLMNSSPDYLALWFALGKLGAVEVPINTAYHGDMLLHQLRTSGATMCAVDGQYFPAVQDIMAESTITKCFVRAAETLPGAKNILAFEQLMGEGVNANPASNFKHNSICSIIFTSGTTGPSKGVLLSYRYLTAYGIMYADINGLVHDDVVMNFLPFFHLSGKFLTIATLVSAGSMRLQARLSISTFMEEVREYNITNFLGVGGICNMLLSRPEGPDDSKCSIRTIYAVPDPETIHTEIERRFNCSLTTVFGSTEVGLPLFRSVSDPYKPGSCGRMSPFYDVMIVDADDNEVPTGAVGEIVVRPKAPFLVASGYVGMPEKTVEAWRNLWLHSGDSGRVDEDGWFYFEDRVSDSLRRRGENISSYEVESLVGKYAGVSEVAAVAFPSEMGEDEVRVFVIAREGIELTPQELFDHCRKSMPYFMVPRYIDIVAAFPRTPTAKVEKYKLRKMPKSDKTWDCEVHGWTIRGKGITQNKT